MAGYVLFDIVNGDYVASDAPGDGERHVYISTCARLCDAEREAEERNMALFFELNADLLRINRCNGCPGDCHVCPSGHVIQ